MTKRLIWNLALPLSLLPFVLIWKWWDIIPVDAPESTMVGFPLPYACDGWFTSGAIQIFVLEMLVDLPLYLLFWSLFVYAFDRFCIRIKIHKALAILFLVIESVIISAFIFLASLPETKFKFKRDFEYTVKTVGVNGIWQELKK